MSIKEIVHYRHGLGLTRAQSATAVGVSTATVSHILERPGAGGAVVSTGGWSRR